MFTLRGRGKGGLGGLGELVGLVGRRCIRPELDVPFSISNSVSLSISSAGQGTVHKHLLCRNVNHYYWRLTILSSLLACLFTCLKSLSPDLHEASEPSAIPPVRSLGRGQETENKYKKNENEKKKAA